MKFTKTKLFIGLFILLAYLGIGAFGLLQFNHVLPEAPMTNCPYQENGFSICENAISHINDWRQFSSVTVSSFVFVFFFFGLVLYFLNKQNFLIHKQYFYRWKYYLDDKALYKSPNKIIKWLSLLENSPAF